MKKVALSLFWFALAYVAIYFFLEMSETKKSVFVGFAFAGYSAYQISRQIEENSKKRRLEIESIESQIANLAGKVDHAIDVLHNQKSTLDFLEKEAQAAHDESLSEKLRGVMKEHSGWTYPTGSNR